MRDTNTLRSDDFATLAVTHTTGPGKDIGGDIGYFGPDELMPELNNVAVGLEVGQHSEIIETEMGFFIIKKTDERRPALDKTIIGVDDRDYPVGSQERPR